MNHAKENQTSNKKKNIVITLFIIIIAIALILLFFKSCGGGREDDAVTESPTATPALGQDGSQLIIDDGGAWNGDNNTIFKEEPIEDFIKFPGFVKIVVNKSNQEIQLYNFPENTVYFVYTISDNETGDIVYQTNAIAPGNATKWNVYDSLNKGEHVVSMSIASYDTTTQELCQTLRTPVTVVVN